jgi:hypothetical protein
MFELREGHPDWCMPRTLQCPITGDTVRLYESSVYYGAFTLLKISSLAYVVVFMDSLVLFYTASTCS